MGFKTMDTPPITAEARGKLRTWVRAAHKRQERFETVITDGDTGLIASNLARRSSLQGRQRAFHQLRRRFAPFAALQGVRLDHDPMAVWTMLKARSSVTVDSASDDPGLYQDCITVNYIMAGRLPRDANHSAYALADGLWSLEVSKHALLRLLQRHRSADIANVLMSAHHTLLRAKMTSIRPFLRDKTARFYLDTGDGVFGCTLRVIKDCALGEMTMHVRARTWLHRDQLSARQENAVLHDEGSPGERLGDCWLLPAPLVRFVRREDGKIDALYWSSGLPDNLSQPRGNA
jgi:hypothetical protein